MLFLFNYAHYMSKTINIAWLTVFLVSIVWLKYAPYNYDNIAGTWRSSAKNINLDTRLSVLCADLRTHTLNTRCKSLTFFGSYDCKMIDNIPFCEECFKEYEYKRDCIHIKNYNVSLTNQNGKFAIENTTNLKHYTKIRKIYGANLDASNTEYFPNDVLCYKYTYHTTMNYCCSWKIVHRTICGSYAGYDYFDIQGPEYSMKIVGINKTEYDRLVIEKYIESNIK